jgi:hypothetical protein
MEPDKLEVRDLNTFSWLDEKEIRDMMFKTLFPDEVEVSIMRKALKK